ncbi:MAG: T9SS type A sorting domain-containing protein, partial [Flammeovirgaceae bacterium]|nr:T9SS type A sorting domain-containing protein [Flammeovirgaceae bacterium]
QVQQGTNDITVVLDQPNGIPDDNSDNESITWKVAANNNTLLTPFRQNFNSSFDAWTILNPTDGMDWNTRMTNYGQSLYFNSFSNTTLSDQAWIVSPIFDLSNLNEASLHFDYTYAQRSGSEERLQAFISNDCGSTLTQVFDLSGSALSNQSSTLDYVPTDKEDWTNKSLGYIDLQPFLGNSEVVVAFAVTNDNGNNVYLDNIELFLTNDPTPLRPANNYLITHSEEGSFGITFNLPDYQPVEIEIIDALGRPVKHEFLADMLNQTVPVNVNIPGLYIIGVNINGQYSTTKIIAR